ncbi:MAG TPA: 6-bladed beta-propeller, partial [Candidatus Binatia bacterium]|nr:6-bladed beta-propeller [Candidatus Binatia bacterium]
MVQVLLKPILPAVARKPMLICALMLALAAPPGYAADKSSKTKTVTVPELELEGGRKLTFEHSFWAEPEVHIKRGFWSKLVDVVAGAPDFHGLISPYEVVEDSRGRFFVTDPGASGIHIFDFEGHKYKFVSREKDQDGLQSPQCLAVDAADNIYVTDSESGKIFVFEPSGKFARTIGSLKGGEGYFKRPTGIAVDSAAQHIYVTDTLRNQVF